MILQLRIAATHVRNRLRQTVVSTLGVALGVGFSIAMAALMEGSQRDFMATLIDAIPHVEIKDDKRTPTAQPASTVYDAVAFRGLRPLEDLRGIRNPTEALASLRDWVDGDIAQRLTGQAVLRYSGQDIGMTLIGVRPKQELLVSNIGEDIRKGDFEDLGTTSNGLVLGDKAAERLGADLGDTVTLTSANGVAKRFKIVGLFHTGITTSDESLAYAPLKAVQILLEKPDIINAITIRLRNIDEAVAIAARAERQLGYKAISWEEANEGSDGGFLCPQRDHVYRCRRYSSGRRVRDLQHHFNDRARKGPGHCHPEIAGVSGTRHPADLRPGGFGDRCSRSTCRVRTRIWIVDLLGNNQIRGHHRHRNDPSADILFSCALRDRQWLGASVSGHRRFCTGQKGRRAQSCRHHPGRDLT
jgi:hypothetical protein